MRKIQSRLFVDEVLLPKLTYYYDNQHHLICEPYSVENLHRMADDLNIKRCWYEKSKRGHCHYDIPKRRVGEIAEKATLITPVQLLQKILASSK